MIYFITQEDDYIKIGLANNPVSRLSELQTGNPHKLTLWFSVNGGVEEERALHKAFW